MKGANGNKLFSTYYNYTQKLFFFLCRVDFDFNLCGFHIKTRKYTEKIFIIIIEMSKYRINIILVSFFFSEHIHIRLKLIAPVSFESRVICFRYI